MNDLISVLSKRGPHRVLVGDLNFAGLPGKVYTPAKGKRIPALAFGHDWRTSVESYHATMRHLASWGIAVAAPDTERGVIPNHRGFASDLESCLQILTGVRLGQGNITIDPHNVYLAGHGMGAGAAILTATGREKLVNRRYQKNPTLAGVISIYPSETTPKNTEAARHVSVPGFILSPGDVALFQSGDPARVAVNWGDDDILYRRIDRARTSGFNEKMFRTFFSGGGRPQWSQQELVRALMVGYILASTDKKYAIFREQDAPAKGTTVMSRSELEELLPENVDLEKRIRSVL